MDPQQRLLLEVAWEALEHAGHGPAIASPAAAPASSSASPAATTRHAADHARRPRPHRRLLRRRASPTASPPAGSRTSSGCRARASRSTPPARRRWWRSTSPARACAPASADGAGRRRQPDPRPDDCDRLLARRACWRPTAAARPSTPRADGFVRGEGCGVVVLKRLSRRAAPTATAILAVIRGIGGQPGRAQQRPDRAERPGAGGGDPARRSPTPASRPADGRLRRGARHRHRRSATRSRCRRSARCSAPGRAADRPLVVGSVKTNIGHLEAAAGVAGLIKVVLALQHGEIPPQPPLRSSRTRTSPGTSSPCDVPDRSDALAGAASGARIAGVSSFGFSGTNAHVVVEEAPRRRPCPSRRPTSGPLHLLALSAPQPSLRCASWPRRYAGPPGGRRRRAAGRRRASPPNAGRAHLAAPPRGAVAAGADTAEAR